MSLAGIEIIGADGCPYVQRVVAFLIHSNVPFTYKNVDLQNKPEWFLEKSPLGKVPALPRRQAIINEFVDDSLPQNQQLAPADSFTRANNKAWLEFISSIATDVYGIVGKPTKGDFDAASTLLSNKYQQLEKEIKGPYFNGDKISLIDFAVAPLAVRLELFDQLLGVEIGNRKQFPKVSAYFKAVTSIPAISTAAHLQRHPDSANSHSNIQALHDKPSDPNVWQEAVAPPLKLALQKRFASAYTATLIKA